MSEMLSRSKVLAQRAPKILETDDKNFDMVMAKLDMCLTQKRLVTGHNHRAEVDPGQEEAQACTVLALLQSCLIAAVSSGVTGVLHHLQNPRPRTRVDCWPSCLMKRILRPQLFISCIERCCFPKGNTCTLQEPPRDGDSVARVRTL
jgi:hypothetical protein